jgi:hypothetical protein
MNDPRVAWLLFVPLVGGAVAALLLLLRRLKQVPARALPWLTLVALIAAVAALLVEGILAVVASGAYDLAALDLSLAISDPAKLVLVTANASLLAAVILSWGRDVPPHGARPEWALIMSTIASSFMAGAVLSTDRIVSGLFLLGLGLPAAALALAPPDRPIPEDDPADSEGFYVRVALARRIAGGLKHIALVTIGASLIIAGALLLGRYAFNLENRTLLALGLGLLAVGLLVRSGAAPFSSSAADLIEAAPGAAIVALGVGAPATLVAGLLMLAPIEGTLASGAAAAWLGAAAAVLAGLRALGAVLDTRRAALTGDRTIATAAHSDLKAMAVASALSWAIFGILSNSHMGATGAILIAANIALSVPLLVMGGRIQAVGAASLLGLPPFGGFAGMLLVAQSAANANGLLLVLLLLGSALVAGAWMASGNIHGVEAADSSGAGWRDWLSGPDRLLALTLVIVQLGMFFASVLMGGWLDRWAGVPWLVAP